jgi:hypothetical protein
VERIRDDYVPSRTHLEATPIEKAGLITRPYGLELVDYLGLNVTLSGSK